jgi:tRNA(Ile)-lysidine synthase
MRITGDDAAFVAKAAEQWLKAKRREPFSGMHPAIQRQIVRQQLLKLGVADPDFELVERLRECPSKAVNAGGGGAVVLSPVGVVRVWQPPAVKFRPGVLDVVLAGRAGEAEFGGLKLEWRLLRRKPRVSESGHRPGREWFDADAVGNRFTLRHWRAGDRFEPIGLGRAVKLQDLFTNLRVPRDERRRRVVAGAAGGAIFWIEGARIGERFKLTQQTKRVLAITWRRAG